MKNEEDSSSKGHVEVAGGSSSGGAFCGGFYCGGEGKNEEGRGVRVSTKVKKLAGLEPRLVGGCWMSVEVVSCARWQKKKLNHSGVVRPKGVRVNGERRKMKGEKRKGRGKREERERKKRKN